MKPVNPPPSSEHPSSGTMRARSESDIARLQCERVGYERGFQAAREEMLARVRELALPLQQEVALRRLIRDL